MKVDCISQLVANLIAEDDSVHRHDCVWALEPYVRPCNYNDSFDISDDGGILMQLTN